MEIQVFLNGERLDLFKDENIELVASVKEASDIEKVYSDYTKSFSVPASQNNNRIYKHYYNASIKFGFDGRVSHVSSIELDHLPFRIGRMQLDRVVMKGNNPSSYNVRFIGGLSSLSKALGESKLNDLDYSSINHPFTRNEIVTRLQGGDGNIIYTLLSPDRKYFFDSSKNLPPDGENYNLNNGIEWDQLQPSVSMIKILQLIQKDKSIYFDISPNIIRRLTGLYMYLSKSVTNIFNPDASYLLDLLGSKVFTQTVRGSQTVGNGRDYISTLTVAFVPDTGFEKVVVRVVGKDIDTGDIVEPTKISGNKFSFTYAPSGNRSRRLEFYISVSRTFTGSVTVTNEIVTWKGLNPIESIKVRVENYGTTNISMSSRLDVSALVNEMALTDFITSLVRMWNLVVIPVSETVFIFKTLDEWRSEGKTYDLSDYIITANKDVSRLDVPPDIKLTFKESDSYLADIFKSQNKRVYGDLTYNADFIGKIDGEAKEIELSFDNMIFSRMIDISNNSPLEFVTGFTDGTENLIHYAVKVNNSSPYKVLDGNGFYNIWTSYNPSHVNNYGSMDYSTVWGEEFEEFTGAKITNSLYKIGYEKEIKKLYDESARIIKTKGRIPIAILREIESNAKIKIDGDMFDISKLNINLTTQEIGFEILNHV